MRGQDAQTGSLFSYVGCEARMPADQPLRVIWAIMDEAPEVLSGDFDVLYASVGRPSIPPEKLLRALLLRKHPVSGVAILPLLRLTTSRFLPPPCSIVNS
jgi:hypothetical protein